MTKPVLASPLVFALLLVACDDGGAGAPGSGGSAPVATGGRAPSGGSTASGGAATTGGVSANGGTSTGGTTAGGAGGAASGGATGGTPATGGSPGGAAQGGSPGGSGGVAGAGNQAGEGSGGDTGGSSGGSGGGAPSACAGALFCDDFESYAPGQAPGGDFGTRVSSGTVSVDQMRSRSGSSSVKFTTEAKDGTKTAFLLLKSDSVFPVMGNHFFGRMMFWLDAAPTTAVHWTILQSTGLVPGQDYRAQYRYGGQHPMNGGSQLMANYETPDSYGGKGPSTDCWHHASGTVIPVGKWTCIEWEFDGPNNALRFWMDGQGYADLTVTGTGQGCVAQGAEYVWTAPTFSELEVGWESYQPDEARTAYVDDLAISTTKIGCPP